MFYHVFITEKETRTLAIGVHGAEEDVAVVLHPGSRDNIYLLLDGEENVLCGGMKECVIPHVSS